MAATCCGWQCRRVFPLAGWLAGSRAAVTRPVAGQTTCRQPCNCGLFADIAAVTSTEGLFLCLAVCWQQCCCFWTSSRAAARLSGCVRPPCPLCCALSAWADQSQCWPGRFLRPCCWAKTGQGTCSQDRCMRSWGLIRHCWQAAFEVLNSKPERAAAGCGTVALATACYSCLSQSA